MYLFYNWCTTLHVSNYHFVHHQEFMIYCVLQLCKTMQTFLTALVLRLEPTVRPKQLDKAQRLWAFNYNGLLLQFLRHSLTNLTYFKLFFTHNFVQWALLAVNDSLSASSVSTQPPIKLAWILSTGGKATAAWRWLPTPSSAEVKEWVDLHLYKTSKPSWPWYQLPRCFFHTVGFMRGTTVKRGGHGVLETPRYRMKILCKCQRLVFGARCIGKRIFGLLFFEETNWLLTQFIALLPDNIIQLLCGF